MMAAERPGRYLLLYGSQTGQAQAIAEEIFERSAKHGLRPELFCMSMVAKKFMVEEEKCVVMVTSTTGDGDAPDTAIKFVRRFNRKALASNYLAHVKYSVLGLGDSNYGNFCNNAKNIDRRFSQLGAVRFHPSAFADEVEGLDVAADPWIDALFPALQKLVGVCSDDTTNGGDTSQYSSSHTHDSSEHDTNDSNLITNKNEISSSENKDERTAEVRDNSGVQSATKKLASDNKEDSSILTDAIGISLENLISQGTEQVADSSVSEKTDMDKIYQETDMDKISQKTDMDQSSVTSDNKTGANSPQEDVPRENYLEIMAPVSDVPSLGVSSSPALSQSSLTLPAATPTFLTVSYLPPDQSLTDKMAELPWQNGCKPPSAASDIVKARVISAQRLTAEDAVKKALLLKISFKGSGLKYRPGDSISIICTNDDREVSQLIQRLGLMSVADVPLKLGILPDTKKRRAAVPPHIPEEGASLRYVLKNCVDIRTPPKKALLRQLADYTSDASEKRRLQELCSKQGAEDYTVFVHTQHVSLLDVLYTFSSCQPPVERLIEHLPRLQPRPYSVCSSEEWLPGHLNIAFNVVTIPSSGSRCYARRGLCTGWLDDITATQQEHAVKEIPTEDGVTELTSRLESTLLKDIEVQIFARTNQHFRTPNDLSVPLIMIGPGTGIAPYIGFLQERQLRLQRERNVGSVGETWLLFGCRHKAKDFLFQSAIQYFQHKRVLTKFLTCFSRDAPDNPYVPKYVQDNVRAHAVQICQLVDEQQAVIFVCGDAKYMADDVAKAFQDIFMQELELSEDKAKEYLMTMRIRHRYLEDVWT